MKESIRTTESMGLVLSRGQVETSTKENTERMRGMGKER